MGWLRTLMEGAEPPVVSFGRLATSCLKHPAWPDYARPQARSLAALFSKLDREIELEWLDDRPEVQAVLTEVLSCSSGAVARPLARGLGLRDQHRASWRVPGAPAARPLDLELEPLPPGLPFLVALPGNYQRHFWSSSPHDRDLVARWLSCRQLALCRPLHELSAEDLASGRPLFAWTDDADPNLDPFAGLERVLVAGPAESTAPRGWAWLEPPETDDYAAELVEWLQQRLPQDGRFASAPALAQLQEAAQHGSVDSLESALGLIAAFDELESVDSERPLLELAQRFLRQRLENSVVSARLETRWLLDHGFRALVGLLQNALADPNAAWDASRTTGEWETLVPVQYQQGVDAEWLRKSLARPGSSVSATQVEAALRAAPPGAFRVIRAFEAAGLLSGVERLRLGPRWLVTLLKQAAEEGLLSGAATEWGELLLQPAAGQSLRRRLEAELQRDGAGVLEALLELEPEEDNPAYAIAVETVFALTGSAVTLGEQFDAEQLHALWEAQRQLWINLDGEWVTPRFLASHRDLPQLGQWLLAAWALSEQLEDVESQAMVNPWQSREHIPELALSAIEAHLQGAAAALETDPGQTRRLLAGYRLLLRLFSKPPLADHELMLMPRLVHDLRWEDLERLHRVPHGVEVLQALLVDGFASFAERAFQLWWDSGASTELHCLHPSSVLSNAFWPHMPRELMGKMLKRDHPFCEQLPYAQLGEDAYRLVVLQGKSLPKAALLSLPGSLLSGTAELLARRGDLEGLEQLWLRFEEPLMRELSLLIEAEQWAVLGPLLSAVPAPCMAAPMQLVRERVSELGIADPLALCARPWLQVMASTEHPARRQAYSLLSDIERRLDRLRSPSHHEMPE